MIVLARRYNPEMLLVRLPHHRRGEAVWVKARVEEKFDVGGVEVETQRRIQTRLEHPESTSGIASMENSAGYMKVETALRRTDVQFCEPPHVNYSIIPGIEL